MILTYKIITTLLIPSHKRLLIFHGCFSLHFFFGQALFLLSLWIKVGLYTLTNFGRLRFSYPNSVMLYWRWHADQLLVRCNGRWWLDWHPHDNVWFLLFSHLLAFIRVVVVNNGLFKFLLVEQHGVLPLDVDALAPRVRTLALANRLGTFA
jgi:hypothetical protein